MDCRFVIKYFALLLLVLSAAGSSPFGLTVSAQSGSTASGSASPLTEEQQKKRADLLQAKKDYDKALVAGKFNDALTFAEKALSLAKEVRGPDHDTTLSWRRGVARLHLQLDDFKSARRLQEETLKLLEDKYGRDHWHVTDARLAIEHTDVLTKLPKEQRQNLDKATKLHQQGMQLYREGKGREAVPLVQEALEVRKAIVGDKHPLYSNVLNHMATLLQDQGSYPQAERLFKEALGHRKLILGEIHPDYSQSLNNLALLYKLRSEYAKAEVLFLESLEVTKATLGDKNSDYAVTLDNLGELYRLQGEYGKAEPLLKRALDLKRTTMGDKDPSIATSLNNLGAVYQSQAEFEKAKVVYKQAMELIASTLGTKHPYYSISLDNLAGLYKNQGEYTRAEPLYKEALEIVRSSLGEKHPYFATSLNNYAKLYATQGEHAQAEALFKQTLEVRKEALGNKHPDYAQTLHDLADLYRARGEYVKAEPLYQKALELEKAALGDKHPFYADTIHQLANVYRFQREYAKAEVAYKQALDILKLSNAKHPNYAACLNDLAGLYQARGDYESAEPLYKQSVELTNEVFGDKHPFYADSLNNLATMYYEQSKFPLAVSMSRKSLEIHAFHLEQMSFEQSEQRQLTHLNRMKSHLDVFLSIAQGANLPADELYEQITQWKGVVSSRQQYLRTTRRESEKNPNSVLAKTFHEFETVTRQLATMTLATPSPAQQVTYQKRLQSLQIEKDQLEKDLAKRSVEIREGMRQVRLSPKEIADLLPEDSALVDLISYRYAFPRKKNETVWERRVVAFVLRKDRPIMTVDLHAEEPIATAVKQWRDNIRNRHKPSDGANDPASVLRTRVWEPLLPHLGDAKTVLISPDGKLNTLPFGALPGKAPNKYLIEEISIAVLPFPQLLYSLQKKPERFDSLLVVGNVDFDAEPGQRGERGGVNLLSERGQNKLQWEALPGTRAELERVRQSYKSRFPDGKLTDLEGKDATEEDVRKNLTNAGIVHLGTHGFFAPPTLKSVLQFDPEKDHNPTFGEMSRRQAIGYNPGLLSGIVFAGANRDTKPDQDDGILTATELGGLNLSKVDLMVLSACETGLGQTAGGEGLLGLQRAMQLAGVRTSVCSLWSVHDAATSVLMEEFYKRLWDKEKPLGKLESLRQAQLYVLKNPDKVIERTKELRAELAKRGLSEDVLRGPKGKDALELPGGGQVRPEERRSPTAWWAAFVLAGER